MKTAIVYERLGQRDQARVWDTFPGEPVEAYMRTKVIAPAGAEFRMRYEDLLTLEVDGVMYCSWETDKVVGAELRDLEDQ